MSQPFSSAVLLRGQTSLVPSVFPPTRDCAPKGVKDGAPDVGTEHLGLESLTPNFEDSLHTTVLLVSENGPCCEGRSRSLGCRACSAVLKRLF